MGPFVPLAEVQQRFGDLVGKAKLPEPFPPPKEARAAVRRALTASAEPPKERRRRVQPGKDGTATPTSALAVLAGWGTFGAGGENSGRRNLQQRQQEVAMHSRCTGHIVEMKNLETELDINFRLTSDFCTPCWAQGPPQGKGTGGTPSITDEDPRDDEVVLQVELTGNPFCSSRAISGKAQGLLVRSHCSWEISSPDAPTAEPVAASSWRSTTPSSRPATPAINLLEPPGTGPSLEAASRPRQIGDACHALRLNMQERMPETLLLSRVQRGQPGGAQGRSQPPVEGSAKALAFLRETEEQCKRLEGGLEQKLQGLCEVLDLRSKESSSVAQLETAGAEPAAALAGAGADFAATSSGPPPESVQGYLRDIRAVLRSLGPGLPAAVRLLEGAVKGLVVAADAELATAARRIKRLEGRVQHLDEVLEREDTLKHTISDLEKEQDHLQEKLSVADRQHEVEKRALRDRVEELKAEIQRLTPDQNHVEGMSGLMADYQTLMQEMEEECGRSSKILRDMTNHAAGIMRDASRQQQVQQGRVVQLKNGEIQLRSYSVAEQSTQVTEADVLRLDPDGPVRLWRPPVRQILVAFEEQEVPAMTLEDLSPEIDKIYTAKIAADLEADAAGLPRSELANFIVEYYLELLGSVRLAQQKFASIVDCIRVAERGTTPIPAKVALFARFLEICHYEAALPLTVLNVVLQAKSQIATKVEAPPVSFSIRTNTGGASRRRGERHESVSASTHASSMRSLIEGESQVGVAVAYQAAVRALPGKGTPAALRELFLALSRMAEVDGVHGARSGPVREFYVLMHILIDCLQSQGAPQLRELITRTEQRHLVSGDEFRDALKDARVLGIDDAVWKPRLCPAGSPTISCELFLDYLGGGALARLPRAIISEGSLLEVVVDAVSADYAERAKHLQRLWQRHVASLNGGPVTYADFKTVLQSAEPSLSPPMVRTLFLTSVETSRSCSQQVGNFCSRHESLEPSPSGEFGGEVVTYRLLALTALRMQLFLKEGGHHHHHHHHEGGKRHTVFQPNSADIKGTPRRTLALNGGAGTGRRASGEVKIRGTTPRRPGKGS